LIPPSLYGRVLRRYLWLLVAAGVIGGVVGAIVGMQLPRSYEATTIALVKPADVSAKNAGLSQTVEQTASVANNLAELATSEQVLRRVAAQVGADPDEVHADNVEVSVPPDTALLKIVYTAESPARAAVVADAIATDLTATLRGVSPSIDGKPAVVMLVVSPALEPVTPANQPRVLFAAAGAVLLALVTFVVGLIREIRTKRLRDADSVESLLQGRVLGTVRMSGPPYEKETQAGLARVLAATRLDPSGDNPDVVTVIPTEDTTVGAGLAFGLCASATEQGRRVLLVDGRLGGGASSWGWPGAGAEDGGLSRDFGLSGETGLSDLLTGTEPTGQLEDWPVPAWGLGIQPSAYGFDVLPAGTAVETPGQLLYAEVTAKLFLELQAIYDLVIVAGPAASSPNEVIAWAGVTRRVLFSLTAGATDADTVRDAAALVDPGWTVGYVVVEPWK
jgi:polysaccharide biosynthesis transport protein